MARQVVDIGVEGNDGTGDSIRESFRKVNTNFQEIYAVVGKGGQIIFTSLADTPDSLDPYGGDGLAAYIPMVAQDASGIEIRRLASDNAEDASKSDTVRYVVTEDGVLILKTANAQIAQDSTPSLGGPLNAAGGAIANIAITQDALNEWNSVHESQLTVEDLVIDKRFGDISYYNRQVPGEEVNIRSEPLDTSSYFKDFSVNTDGLAVIPEHGITFGSTGAGWFYSTDGDLIEYTYTERLQSGAAQTIPGVLAEGQPVYIRRRNDSLLEFYVTAEDAIIENDNSREEKRLKLTGGTGTQTIENPYYDATLSGNWLSNEAIPRSSILRRQGDTMEGNLYLNDHPGALSGAGAPNGIGDLQAATRLYADSQSTASSTSIFVSTQGRDDQRLVADSTQGRSLFYAFKSISAAARKAEEIQVASKYEPGPFMQDITYTEVAGNNVTTTPSTVTSAGVNNATTGDIAVQRLVNSNIDFIIAEVTAWIDNNIATKVTTTIDWGIVTYNKDVMELELARVINAAVLDHMTGLNRNTLSIRVGQEYFAQPDLLFKAGLTKDVFQLAIQKVKEVIAAVLVNNSGALWITQQSDFVQVVLLDMPTESGNSVPVSEDGLNINNMLGIIQDIVINGVFSAPLEVAGNRYLLKITNGTNAFVDQGAPQNRDLRVGKLVQGKSTGALGLIVGYTPGESLDDEILMSLLAPIEFRPGEQLAFGNASKERNTSIKVESGIYYEDFPIRLPANTSIVGDESRRCILRPKRTVSQSQWANVYFYRDSEFDTLRGDSTSVTSIPDTNIPVAGTIYTNPVTEINTGFFGRHYLNDPTKDKNVDNNGQLAVDTTSNPGGFADSAALIARNKNYIVAETIAWIKEQTLRSTPPANFAFTLDAETEELFSYAIRGVVTAVTTDLNIGGSINVLTEQGELFYDIASALTPAMSSALGYVSLIWRDVLENTAFTRDAAVTPYIGVSSPAQYINTNLINDDIVYNSTANTGVMLDFVALLQFASNAEYNPAKRASQIDSFMLNDASMIKGVTVQGHGGFAAVLDPAGQILTKSPFVYNVLTFSQSLNRQAFRGGVFVDGYCANTPLTVTAVADNGFTLTVQAEQGSALGLRKPQLPAPFYINGVRYQVNDILEYNPDAGIPTAKLVIDPHSGIRDINGDYFGFQETVGGGFDITLQTPGSRTVATNDSALVNDLGYGLAAANGAIIEAASTFTFYSWAGYQAVSGAQIRSVTGTNSYGVNGVVAEGSDPNEVPDNVVLVNDIDQAALTFSASVVLYLNDNVSVLKGDTITQTGATGGGTVLYPSNSRQVYLETTSGLFNTVGNILVNAADSGVVPTKVDDENYSNPVSRLAIHFYETESTPNARSDISYYHNESGAPGTISRYQVTTINKLEGVVLDGHIINSPLYTTNFVSRTAGEVVGTGAILLVEKSLVNGGQYSTTVYAGAQGNDYKVGDTFTILGVDLNGVTPTHNAVATVKEVTVSLTDQGLGLSTGAIAKLSITGDINAVTGLTPQRSGQVYRASFSTNNDEFNPDGLLSSVDTDKPLMLRSNRNFVFDRIRDTDRLTIRPSTAINFAEQPEFTYRAISFAREDAIGSSVDKTATYTSTDISFDFVQLVVANNYKVLTGADVIELDSTVVNSSTLGGAVGDSTIAIGVLSNRADIHRLNDNSLTDLDFRPPFNNNAGIAIEYTNKLPMIVTWQGKKHYVVNYREVLVGTSNQVQVGFSSDANTFALVDLLEVSGATLGISGATTVNRLGSLLDIAIIRQLTTGATGNVKVDIVESTVIKLSDILGNFNTTDALEISYNDGVDYVPLLDNTDTPVIITTFDARDTNLTSQSTGIAEPLTTALNDNVTLRAAIQDGSPAVITIQISTVRATGHDFNNVGTGSYNDTNFPNVVLGNSVNSANQASQVQERNKGRVFYASTDQDGLFKVGRFFTVDQGTGIVTIAANIALSDVDGIGFRRGVVVSEFSTDTAMSDNATDAVPTESAVRGYVSRRLGFDQTGTAVSNPLGPSVIAANGSVAMEANLSLGGNSITNLAPVDLELTPLHAAVPRSYVDSRTEAFNKLADLRDVEMSTAGVNQLIGISGVKTIYIASDTLSGSAFATGRVLTDASGVSNYGTIVGRRAAFDENYGNVLIINFTPGADTFAEATGNDPLIYHKASNATQSPTGQGAVKIGPFFEVVNLTESGASNIQLTIIRPNNDDENPGTPDLPAGSVNLQIKAGAIDNSHINASASIVQSKLTLQEAIASVSAIAPGADAATVQARLGLAEFDDVNFTVTRGRVSLKSNGISIAGIQQIPTDTVLGRSATGTGNVTTVGFSTVVDEGNGIQLTDFPYTNTSGVESGDYASAGVLTRVGNDDFTVIPATVTGGNNSFVKTSSTGRVVVNDLAVGKDPTFVVLKTSGVGSTTLTLSTPNGGTILTSQGASSPLVSIPGNLDIGATGVTQTNIQANSGAAGTSWISSRWARHFFIEAISEGGVASTGISIGAGSGKTLSGQVGIVVANTGNNTSPVPFLFSSTGAKPDISNVYDIGISTARYRNLWINNINATGDTTLGSSGSNTTTVNGTLVATGTQTVQGLLTASGLNNTGNTTLGSSGSNTTTVNGTLVATGDQTVQGLLTASGLNNTGNTTLGTSGTNTITVNGNIITNVLPKANVAADSGLNLGSNSNRWNTVYATVLDGTATQAKYADLAENYLADEEYEAGTVLIFGGSYEITTTTTKGDYRAAGVVSTNPAHLMNSGLEGNNVTALALQGRVPCKVIGKVQKGDIIVTGGAAGYGCVNNNPAPGTMIGKAVGVKETDGRGTVEVVVGR
jgi:hypothetical protein